MRLWRLCAATNSYAGRSAPPRKKRKTKTRFDKSIEKISKFRLRFRQIEIKILRTKSAEIENLFFTRAIKTESLRLKING